MSTRKPAKPLARSILQDRCKAVEDVRRLADANSAAVARVLRGWLMDGTRDKK